MSGHVSGDIASAAVIDALQPYDEPVSPAELPRHLAHAVAAANRAMQRRISADRALAGMGTTLVMLAWSDTIACLANVGDSRAYLLHRGGGLQQMTEDHTYAHLLADADAIQNLPERLFRWLDGRPGGRSPDITTRRIEPGDRWLLCSDGLSSFVPHEMIYEVLHSIPAPSKAVDRLVELALKAGGKDNITVVVIDFEATAEAAATPPSDGDAAQAALADRGADIAR